MANTNDNQTFDLNYLLSEKPADGYYISASNYLQNHEPEILTQPNQRLFRSRDGSCEIKFYFENHSKFYRPDIFCPFNLSGTGTPELKFRLQLSKSVTIPVTTLYSAANQGDFSVTIASTDTLLLNENNWITFNGLSTKYWLAQNYNWEGGDHITVNLVDEIGNPLALEVSVSAGDDIYHNKLGNSNDDIIFDREYRGVLPIYPWGTWTPYSLTTPWGGYDGTGVSDQFIVPIFDSEYLSENSVYCGKLTIAGGATSGIAMMRLFIGQSTIRNAYIEKPFETVINFVNDKAIHEIFIKYYNLDITTYTRLNEMATTIVANGDDVLFFLSHAEKNYVFAGFIPKNELKITLRDSVMNCDAKYSNEWDFGLKISGYS